MHAEHVDVLIVGAGISGVGAGYHLQTKCPRKTFAILEARDASAAPGTCSATRASARTRTCSRSATRFRPWTEAKAIADGPSILDYVRETAREYGIDRKIRFGHRVVAAEWSSDDARWTVDVERVETGETMQMTVQLPVRLRRLLPLRRGLHARLPGHRALRRADRPPADVAEDLDYAGKRVVVIGSGATAVTLVPAMAERAAHVTMLQRSPSYIVSLPADDPIAEFLRRLLPAKLAYSVLRWKNMLMTMLVFQLSRRRPEFVKRLIRRGVERQLPPGYDVDTHFKPRYNPWDQRMCLVPDGDLFAAISDGSASVVTDRIETFTETGLALGSGAELDADVVVTATGLKLVLSAASSSTVDGERVDLPETMGYKGMMLSGVPNMAFSLGYTNASWTLKCDLTCEYVCRLLNHMERGGYATARRVDRDPSVTREPFIDFSSGYVHAGDREVPQAGVAPAVAAVPELRARHRLAALRLGRGRRDGVLARRRGPAARSGSELIRPRQRPQ